MTTAESTLATPTRSGSRSPGRTLLASLGAAIAVGLVLFGALSLIELAAEHSFDVHASYAGVRSLTIDDGAGDVVLRGAPAGSRLTVTEHVRAGLSSPTRQATLAPGGALRLSEGCHSSLDPECTVRYTVAVPAGIPVAANSGAGNVSAGALHTSGTVALSSGAGDVTATDVSSTTSLELGAGAGDVSASRIGAPALRVSSGAGDVTADVVGPISSLVASSGAGDVTLSVPPATYDVHATSGAGGVADQALATNPTAARRITASSGAGEVTITPTG
jgi:putative adhesin